MISKWLITIGKSPIPGVVGPLPNGRTLWLTNRGDPNHLQVMDAPPSSVLLPRPW